MQNGYPAFSLKRILTLLAIGVGMCLILPLGMIAEHPKELCGEFNRIANWVNTVANTVNKIQTPEIGETIEETLEQVRKRLLTFYKDVSTSKYLSADEKQLGGKGLQLVDQLNQAITQKRTDPIVHWLDQITDNLDRLTDQCRIVAKP